ncbi:flagellar hook-basal body complex protein [Metabacillus schmidteae]|uniref:flagellar hook-basal body complex protein n=1 Tax=Metabacillus schmidteae TaxID=2730405 RepID=UPI001589A9BB|nr:flagellar hook-basal body complex protein [Metabacillus schmidteae]
MLRSLYSGISGMKNFQTKLDVIGNNIANVNTYGFKKSRTTFADLVNQQIAGAAGATQTNAGTNAQQIGLGSKISSIDTIHTAGSTQTTSRTLDLSLSGDGFFPVAQITDLANISIDQGNQIGNNIITGSINNAVDLNYTRAGNFYLDDKGYLVTAEGMYLIGEAGEKTIPDEDSITKSQNALNEITNFGTSYSNMLTVLEDISKQANDLLSAYQDYNQSVSNYNKSEAPDENGPLFNVMQSSHTALTSILAQFDETAGNYNDIAETFRTENVTDFNTEGIREFNGADPIGTIVKEINSTIATIEGEYTNTPPAEWENVDNQISQMNDIISTFNTYQIELENIGRAVVNFEGIAEDLQKPKFSNRLSGEAGLIQIPLTAQSFSIGSDGTVTFVNDKGELNVAGQVRVATFANAGGLEKQGGNLYRESANSGAIDKNNNGIQLDELSVAGSDGVASIIAGALEMSNVDLSEEFTEMIVAQRGFQSNTKIITTSDEILQELMGLKR